MNDTIVQEIRDIRAARAQAFGCDLNQIMSDALARDSAKRFNSKIPTKSEQATPRKPSDEVGLSTGAPVL